jgi:hypothetical protein
MEWLVRAAFEFIEQRLNLVASERRRMTAETHDHAHALLSTLRGSHLVRACTRNQVVQIGRYWCHFFFLIPISRPLLLSLRLTPLGTSGFRGSYEVMASRDDSTFDSLGESPFVKPFDRPQICRISPLTASILKLTVGGQPYSAAVSLAFPFNQNSESHIDRETEFGSVGHWKMDA